MTERREHRDGTERAAADAEHHEIVIVLSHVFGAGEDVLDDGVLGVRQIRPLRHARAAARGKLIVRRASFRFRGFEVGVRETVRADVSLHHVVEIEFKHKCLRQCV